MKHLKGGFKENKELTVVQVVGEVGLDEDGDKGLSGGKLEVVHDTWV